MTVDEMIDKLNRGITTANRSIQTPDWGTLWLATGDWFDSDPPWQMSVGNLDIKGAWLTTQLMVFK